MARSGPIPVPTCRPEHPTSPETLKCGEMQLEKHGAKVGHGAWRLAFFFKKRAVSKMTADL